MIRDDNCITIYENDGCYRNLMDVDGFSDQR